jgi:hypothetical protein
MSLEPFGMYRKSERLPTILEAGAMLGYKDLLWAGGSYRMDYGATAYVGLILTKNISFAYAYEFAGGQQVNLGSGGHELNFKVRFGKNKHQKQREMVAVAVPETVEVQTLANEEPEEESAEIQSSIEEGSIVIEEIDTIKTEEDPNFNKPKPDFAPGYYVVLGAFEIYDNAIMFTEVLNKKGIEVDYGYNEEKSLYYVYNLHTQDFSQADKLKNRFKQWGDYKDAWVYDVR